MPYVRHDFQLRSFLDIAADGTENGGADADKKAEEERVMTEKKAEEKKLASLKAEEALRLEYNRALSEAPNL